MRATFVVAAASLTLMSCGQAAVQPDQEQATDGAANVLTCETFSELTPASLAERYGAENITTATLPGPEGESYEATLVFANDAARKIEVVWIEGGEATASILVHGTQWIGPDGLRQGASMADVQRINGGPFKFWGYGWDYGGWVSDWAGGALDQRNGCTVRAHFEARDLENAGAMGDSEFMSDSPAAQSGDPYMTGFGFALGH
ncbi:hypothetical protein [Terricaulis sp.]|uniref:hypothetical protein n=1 Tax=Terricaulis sp. TaxID=2768686 RepID=UPI002AC70323|nr:hypothetical protein [Terricaulis sp.]MDZ4690563.1 hypothetical protein [Terricaulis sp.]